MRPRWGEPQPNHGFLLEDRGSIVGAYLALYATRLVDGRREPFCNLAAWCVLPTHRHQGLRLLRALLAQPGYHFTDLSPSGNVVELNRRLRFEALDTTTALVPNLPFPRLPRGEAIRLISEPRGVLDRLGDHERVLYEDHIGAAAAHHLVLARGPDTCYVVFRRDRRKDLPLFASLLYVSNPSLFEAGQRLVYRHLLLRHRIPFTLVELRVSRSRRPRLARMLRSPRPKMYRSPTLAADQIDYLYSELVCVSW